VWGFLHALFIMPSILLSTNRNNLAIVAEHQWLPTWKETLQLLVTFFLTSIAWVFFRSPDLTNAWHFLRSFGKNQGHIDQLSALYPMFASLMMIVMEWMNRKNAVPFSNVEHRYVRYFLYLLILYLIFMMGAFINPRSFIYFQF
jgi:D-alanyl-lipoteichoic acid acyltransferase DltB (MBOAT superfamily)